MPKIISTSVGKSSFMFVKGRGLVRSAINKHVVSNPVEITELGIVGDEQSDKLAHGGVGQAVYAYPIEHYAFWEKNKKFKHGHFGENLTVSGILEPDVYIDDVWIIGQVKLQVTKQRTPCLKFNAKMKSPTAGKEMMQSGRTGWYLKVLAAGSVKAGDDIEIVPGPCTTSISSRVTESVNKWEAL